MIESKSPTAPIGPPRSPNGGAPWPLYDIGLKQVAGPTLSQVCGTGKTEDQVIFNFTSDAIGGHSMLDTAEQHDVLLRRYAQHQDALADDYAFQKRYMTLPFSVPKPNFKGEDCVLQSDQGIFATSADKLARLSPVLEGGTVTFGGQTHPADGGASIIVTTPGRAADLSSDPGIRAHNPFAINDIAFARETGADLDNKKHYGCSLIWGHPRGPTGLRAIIELIEELALRGGGIGMFHGCAAGDSSLSTIIEVSDR